MVNYSPRAAKAIAQLKRFYNDVDIFVEDTANHNMWLLVARSLLPPGTRLDSVTMLGGRNAVIAACKLDQTNNGRKKLYIIDGDFDFLFGRKKDRLKYLYRLRANNIENLLISEEALVSMALEHQPKKPEALIIADIDFANCLRNIEHGFVPLFVAYAVTQKLDPSIKTTSYSVKNLIVSKKSGVELDPLKIRSRILSLYLRLARSVGIARVRTEKRVISANASSLPLSQVVSGKDYVLPIIFLKFQATCGYGRGDESFKVALARSFSRQVEPYFARRMANLAA